MLRRLRHVYLALFLVGTLCKANLLFGQELIIDPRLTLLGPDEQSLYLTVRYFDDGILAKTVTSRVELKDGGTTEQLEFGHSGIHVLAVVPTHLPVTVTLQDGERELASKVSGRVETLELSAGVRPADDAYSLPRVLLSDQEASLARAFLSALVAGSTESLVSTSPIANIDWQTLNAFCKAVTEELGKPAATAGDLDGWLSWEGNLGVRVISGTFEFEHGRCKFELMAADRQLVDVTVRSSGLPEPWFDGPDSEEAYIRAGEQLAQALFAGDIQLAHSLFSNRYYQTVTEQALQGLYATLHQRFGQKLGAIEFKRTELGPYDADTRSRPLRIYHAFNTNSGKRCISRVEVVFPCGPDIISRGHLASIQIRETWQSAEPQLVELAAEALQRLGISSAPDAAPAPLVHLLHPHLASHTDGAKIVELCTSMRDPLGRLVEQPDWDTWNSTSERDRSTVSGVVAMQKANVDVKFDFVEGHLLGVTLLSPTSAFSTLDLLVDTHQIQAIAQSFWTKLLAGDLAAAYDELAPVFKQQLPFEEFQDLIQQSDIQNLSKLITLHVDATRLTDRLDRPLALMTSVYLIAELEGGVFQPLRCEFGKSEDATHKFELLDFNTDFEARFPVAAVEPMRRLVDALRSGQPGQIVTLLSPGEQDDVDPRILDGFLRNLLQIAGEFESPTDSRMTHEYTTGRRIELGSCQLDTAIGKVPTSAVFEYGQLRSFALHAPQLGYFLNAIQGQQCYHDAALKFLSTWFNQGSEPSRRFLIAELRTTQTIKKLEQLRGQSLLLNGRFQSATVKECVLSPSTNEIQMRVDATFENGTVPLQLELAVDAFAARLSGIEAL